MYLMDKKKRLALRIDDELMKWLEDESKYLRCTVSDLVRMILQAYAGGRHANVKRT